MTISPNYAHWLAMTARSRHLSLKSRRPPPGSPPGTFVPSLNPVSSVVTLMAYDAERLIEQHVEIQAFLHSAPQDLPVSWVHVQGLGDLEALRALGERFGLHPLVLEDILHLDQCSKWEAHEDHLFLVMHLPDIKDNLCLHQFSLVLGRRYVLTFLDLPCEVFRPVCARLKDATGRLRRCGPDYLAYTLIDTIVDHYFPVLEQVGDRVETLEKVTLTDPEADVLSHIHAVKRDLLSLRRTLWPQREVLNELIQEETAFIQPATMLYLRDCADHAFQLLDMVEIYREVASELIDIYLSSTSARLSEVMKVLTMIATIFIPLSFIAGIYGMNFDPNASPWNMPELGWYWGYPLALTIMLSVGLGMLVFFWRRGWIGRRRRQFK